MLRKPPLWAEQGIHHHILLNDQFCHVFIIMCWYKIISLPPKLMFSLIQILKFILFDLIQYIFNYNFQLQLQNRSWNYQLQPRSWNWSWSWTILSWSCSWIEHLMWSWSPGVGWGWGVWWWLTLWRYTGMRCPDGWFSETYFCKDGWILSRISVEMGHFFNKIGKN